MVTLMYNLKSSMQVMSFQNHPDVIDVDQHAQGMNPIEENQFGTRSVTSQTPVHYVVIN